MCWSDSSPSRAKRRSDRIAVKEPRLAQLSRIFQADIATTEAARAAISARPGDFASALVHLAPLLEKFTAGFEERLASAFHVLTELLSRLIALLRR